MMTGTALPRSRAMLLPMLAAAAIGLVACAPADSAAPNAASPSPSVSGIEGRFEVEDGRSLALKCSGEGEPTVVYDAGTGSGGIEALRQAMQVKELSAVTRVCAYDRAGTGTSDPAPDHPRTVDDLVDDLHALLDAAEIAPPYLLVGSSGGGFDVYHYAGRHPDEVAGLVMDDVPAPQAAIPPSEVPAWDSPDNPEHMDYVLFEHQLAVDRLPIPAIPVTVLWATRGQSATQDDQDLWLEGSSNPQSVAVESTHDIMHGSPGAVADAISEMLTFLRG
jgi:pimeloyl-ACP methyl ester carboxylesterase